MNMKTTLSRVLIIAAMACLTAAHADHMSPWGTGWANMPNDIHNTRFDTRGDNDTFRDFVMYGEGADIANRYLAEAAAALESELASGHQVDQLAARLDPVSDFLGGGWARYTLFDDDPLVSRVLNINIRLRLIKQDGSVANEALGLTADNADDVDTSVSAYFSRYVDESGGPTDYAKCSLVFDGLILEDEVAEYASYSVSLKADQTGMIAGTGGCTDLQGVSILPDVYVSDVVDIGVLTLVTPEEVVQVLMGHF